MMFWGILPADMLAPRLLAPQAGLRNSNGKTQQNLATVRELEMPLNRGFLLQIKLSACRDSHLIVDLEV